MTANVDSKDAVRYLTIKEIRDALPPDTFTSGEKRSRSKLEDAASMLPLDRSSSLSVVPPISAKIHATGTVLANDESNDTFLVTV